MTEETQSEQTDLVSLRRQALERVRNHYEDVARLSRLRLDQINRGVAPAMQYSSLSEYVRELYARAQAVTSFAGYLGLISPEEARAVVTEFLTHHPEMAAETWAKETREEADYSGLHES